MQYHLSVEIKQQKRGINIDRQLFHGFLDKEMQEPIDKTADEICDKSENIIYNLIKRPDKISDNIQN